MKLVELLLNNTIFQIINSLFGVLGLIVIFCTIVKKRKKIVIFLKPTEIFSQNSMVEVKNTYNDTQIDSLTVTELILWNRNKSIIEKSDFIKQIEIHGKNDLKILDGKLIANNCDNNVFDYTLDNNNIVLNFDYLKKNQGIKFQIIHTGKIEDLVFVIESNVVNYSIKKHNYTANFISKKKQYNLLPIIYLIMTIFLSTIPVNSLVTIIKNLSDGKTLSELSSSIVSFISLLINFSLIFYPKCISSIRKEFRINVPKGIR